MENPAYERKVCYRIYNETNFKCDDFRNIEQMRVMLDNDNKGVNNG